MKTILEYLTDCVGSAFQQAGYEDTAARVTTSDRPDLCQYQCNGAFAAAKQYRENPMTVAEKVSDALRVQGMFEQVDAIRPGFINMTLTDRLLLDYLEQMSRDERAGMPTISQPQTIILDYGGPNIAKPLHIGHLRSAIIGESIKRIFRYAGYDIIGDVHIGDWGLPMGLIIAELRERNPQWSCFSKHFNPRADAISDIEVNELNKIYPYASAKSKQDAVFLSNAKEITYQLQQGHKGYDALWRKIRKASVHDLKKIYSELLVDFDLWNGESDANAYVARLIDILERKGLLRESDGAMVVDVSEESDSSPMPPVLIRKSDDSILYATTDLATLIQRMEDYRPAKIWYVVDSRQSLHFDQVFRCARRAELVKQETELEFLGFGTMNGTDGKPFKTRDGGVMRLEDLLDLGRASAHRQITKSGHLASANEQELLRLANRISIASIKFGDLINHRTKNYVFDIDKFTSFEGKTGPYILYSITRINSIFKKLNAPKEEGTISTLREPEERNLVLSLLNSSEAFQQAVNEKAPNIICEHVYNLANVYSKFYQACNIIYEPNPERQRDLLNLTAITEKYLLLFLELLGIEPVEQM